MRICNREIFAAQFIPAKGLRDLRDIKTDEWESYLSNLALDRNWAPATFNRRRALLMSFYNWCMEKGLVPDNPLKRVRKRREAQKEPRFLSSAQLQCFLEVCEASPYATCFYILANTGMRISEALGLRWCDVDLMWRWQMGSLPRILGFAMSLSRTCASPASDTTASTISDIPSLQHL